MGERILMGLEQIIVQLNPDVPPTGSDLKGFPRRPYHQRVVEAVQRGYYVTLCGRLFGPKGQLKVRRAENQHCPTFSTNWSGRVYGIPVHKLAAYQWFGEAAFAPGTHVRHLDANTENFKITNLRLGTATQNARDVPPEQRAAKARHARAAQGFTSTNAKLTPEDVRHIRAVYAAKTGKTVAQGVCAELCRRYGVSRTVINKVVRREYYPNVA
jgi:hypothetical protein